ncbi:primosomal protein N' [uncultured Campylobacter sp.]|uniref:primosomal protein N' n=1 Tax=uncultured Campylobacter sp. TaxID=218934 RepID=UPI002623329D|nr:primosomal protein N' [uncultured Campylobacter sp.]
MLYYQIIPSGLNLKPLTYCSDFKIPNFTQVLINIKNKKTIGYVLQSVAEPNFKTLEILEILPATLTPIQISLLKFISHYYVVNLSIAAGLFTPLEIEAPCLQNLTQAQILSDKNETNAKFDDSKELNLTTELNETSESNLPENLNNNSLQENLKLNESVATKLNFNNPARSPKTVFDHPDISEFFPKIPNLNQDQQEALNFAKIHKTSLIFGDTGSGKSEIYFSLIREYLLAGKQVLLLMPEISLTPQMTKRLKSYFGEKFGVWHSKITPKKRGEILQKFQSREINLIAGARSALFLPFTKLGLIIVDEEHDDSYKSAQNPHYNARDLALFLASKFDIKVVLGSATPSVVSFKKQPHFRLRGTFFKSEKKFIYDESETGLSDVILGELAASFTSGKQAVVFLPTRANFRYLSCRECGSAIKCPFCSVGMSFYKKRNVLKCQYCGFMTAATCSCEKCGSEMIEAKKIGTDELTDALRSSFPAARIEKFDRDEITTQNKLEKTLKAFNAGEIDALVGTQMLSKGHDYHNVDLAVIMGVDELLNFPDFRARERTLALAMQVAGRAGRSGEGRVVVQSRQREFFENFITDYDAFLAEEIAAREPIYPPFARLLRVIVSEKSEQAAKQRLELCVAELEKLRMAESSLEIVGHGKCAIEILGGKYRFEILLRSASHAPLIKAARICAAHGFDVDMDPINFS